VRVHARPTTSPAAEGGAATVLVAIAVLLGLFGMHGLEIGHGAGLGHGVGLGHSASLDVGPGLSPGHGLGLGRLGDALSNGGRLVDVPDPAYATVQPRSSGPAAHGEHEAAEPPLDPPMANPFGQPAGRGSAEMCAAALPILLLSLLVGARAARRSKRLRSAAAPSTDPVAMWGSPPGTRHTSLHQLCVLRT
jgi:hypothetical protein